MTENLQEPATPSPKRVWFFANVPLPPSINRIYKSGINHKTKKLTFYRDPAYNKWEGAADIALAAQRLLKNHQTINEPFDLWIDFELPPAGDVDNRIKPLLDWLQPKPYRKGIITNDKLCQRLTAGRVSSTLMGCRLWVLPPGTIETREPLQ